ncbi:hypothetical protein ACWGKW_25000 [Streptomyces sp. NPDC054766]
MALGPLLAERDQQHHVGGQLVRQVERYYLARVDAVDPAAATQPDQIRERRWWTTAELHNTTKTVYPLGLADLLTGLAHGAPVRPVVLTG